MIKKGDYVKCKESKKKEIEKCNAQFFEGYKRVINSMKDSKDISVQLTNNFIYPSNLLKKRKDLTMSLQEFTTHMEAIIKFTEKANQANTALSILTDNESVVAFEFAYQLLDSYITLLNQQVNDTSDWIYYFLYDCNCGNTPKEVSIGTKVWNLKDIKTLYRVIIWK